MKQKLPVWIFPALALSGLLLSACGRNPARRDFEQALPLEERVGTALGEWIATQGGGTARILLLRNGAQGSWQTEMDDRRIRGLKKALPGATLTVVDLGAGPEEEAQLLQMDEIPPDLLLREVEAQRPDLVISFAGAPYHSMATAGLPPLHVFGVRDQSIARHMLETGWAASVLYSRGVNDRPGRFATPLPSAILETYQLESRP